MYCIIKIKKYSKTVLYWSLTMPNGHSKYAIWEAYFFDTSPYINILVVFINIYEVLNKFTDTLKTGQTHLQSIMKSRITPMQPIIIIIFMLAHHCFRFNLPACCSNCDAPCCNASARWSNSVNFESRSNTFSTLTRIIPTTSSTWACVCCNRFCAGFVPPIVLLLGGGGNVGILIRLILFIDACSDVRVYNEMG